MTISKATKRGTGKQTRLLEDSWSKVYLICMAFVFVGQMFVRAKQESNTSQVVRNVGFSSSETNKRGDLHILAKCQAEVSVLFGSVSLKHDERRNRLERFNSLRRARKKVRQLIGPTYLLIARPIEGGSHNKWK